jgi:hypothetical protein
MKQFSAVLLCMALSPLATAQQKAAHPNPADPSAPVPPSRYESPFAGYLSYREQDLTLWQEVNDEVARAGGHIGILKGAGHDVHVPAQAPSRAPATNTVPKPQEAPPAGHGPDHK